MVADQPELSIDDPDLSISEKISRLKVHTLVKEFLGAQELQLLGDHAMAAAIETFVDKDDTHAIQKYVSLVVSGVERGFSFAILLAMLLSRSRKWLKMYRGQNLTKMNSRTWFALHLV